MNAEILPDPKWLPVAINDAIVRDPQCMVGRVASNINGTDPCGDSPDEADRSTDQGPRWCCSADS